MFVASDLRTISDLLHCMMPGAVVSIDLLGRGAVVSIDLLGRGAVVSTDMRSLGRSAGIGERGAWSAGRRGASSHLGVVREKLVRRDPSRPRHGTARLSS